MNALILEFAKSFTKGRLSAEVFVEAYMEMWRIERDNNNILKYEGKLSECLSSIFCLADLYNSDPDDREEYELDNEQLCEKVSQIINQLVNS
ncbi:MULTISPECIES: colicin immunity domain-containing protein [Photorhabdus]|uniref:colicin immunity domain-containing protein n=1 Tax=Photorhabdus TaxID=29487 RepID=UPI001E4A2F1C|nr:colicin immunity domain-containing protein [Photorhabdus aegyptia]MCC8459502.1 colicin immunity protein [Photorhabdus aegyptia]